MLVYLITKKEGIIMNKNIIPLPINKRKKQNPPPLPSYVVKNSPPLPGDFDRFEKIMKKDTFKVNSVVVGNKKIYNIHLSYDKVDEFVGILSKIDFANLFCSIAFLSCNIKQYTPPNIIDPPIVPIKSL